MKNSFTIGQQIKYTNGSVIVTGIVIETSLNYLVVVDPSVNVLDMGYGISKFIPYTKVI